MGFLNHCLHKHGIKYKNEAAALTSTAATPVVRVRARAWPHPFYPPCDFRATPLPTA